MKLSDKIRLIEQKIKSRIKDAEFNKSDCDARLRVEHNGTIVEELKLASGRYNRDAETLKDLLSEVNYIIYSN